MDCLQHMKNARIQRIKSCREGKILRISGKILQGCQDTISWWSKGEQHEEVKGTGPRDRFKKVRQNKADRGLKNGRTRFSKI